MASADDSRYPTTAYILTLIGGIFIVLGGLAAMAVYAIGASFFFAFFPGASVFLVGLGLVGLLFGILILYGAIKMKHDPRSAHTWGILVILFSIFSWVGWGGFVVGFLLALIGGILALVWRPPVAAQAAWGQPTAPPPPLAPAPPTSAAAPGQKVCSSCGSANAAGTQFCAKCGAALPA